MSSPSVLLWRDYLEQGAWSLYLEEVDSLTEFLKIWLLPNIISHILLSNLKKIVLLISNTFQFLNCFLNTCLSSQRSSIILISFLNILLVFITYVLIIHFNFGASHHINYYLLYVIMPCKPI